MHPQISEFRLNDRPWRLDWLGRIIYPGTSQSEPYIMAYLSELKPEYGKVLSNDALANPEQHHSVPIKIGQLPLLNIGSVWCDGIPQPPAEAPKELEIELHHSQIDLVPFNGQVEIDGESMPALGARQYRIGSDANREVAGSWLAIAYNPTPSLQFVAIPCTAIFQKCVATSPKAIRRLVYGHLDKIIDLDRSFYTRRPNSLYVTLFKDFRDKEVASLVNLVVDPVGIREYGRFRNELVTESANFDQTRSGTYSKTFIKMGLPFSNPVNLRLRGKYLPFGGNAESGTSKRWGFLATEIVDLTVRLVFDDLVIGRKNSGKQGENAGDPDLPTAYGTKSISAGDDPLVQPVTSVPIDPAKDLEARSLEACGGFNVIGLKVTPAEKDEQHYRAAPGAGEDLGDVDPDGTGTTGDPVGPDGRLIEIDVDPTSVPKVPVTLEQFLATLDRLASSGLAFKTVATTKFFRTKAQHVINYLPRRIRNVRSWHLISDDARAEPRGYVAAEIRLGATWHYLIELERKGNEALALAHIREYAGARIEPSRLHQFMIDVARANGWNATEEYPHWVYRPIRHTPSKGIDTFARAIATRFNRVPT